MLAGFLNLNKPPGFTSHDCIARVRKLLKLKRVGHAGTLDPAAIGVLPIALGSATRLLQFLPSEKAYIATVRFGQSTTTDDLEGDILTNQPCSDLLRSEVEAILPRFLGQIQQTPPIYSAIQVQGQRLYDKARSGQIVEVQPRRVEVSGIEILDWRSGEFPEIDLAIACGPGTYIRSIARDLGQALKTGGTLAALTRTLSAGFELTTSLTLDALAEIAAQGAFEPILPEVALQHVIPISLPDALADRWCQGQKIPWQLGDEPVAACYRVHRSSTAEFLGMTKVVQTPEGFLLCPQVVLGMLQA
jgi:tRNA pseudouridine55 synthase